MAGTIPFKDHSEEPSGGALAQAEPQLSGQFTTRDGYPLSYRLIRAADARLLIDLFDRLSPESRRRRFHANLEHLSGEAKWERASALANVDNRTLGGAVLAIERDADGCEQVVGVARLARPPDQPHSPEAEVAVVVRDDFQGRGVGSELLRRMARLAQQMGVRTLVAEIEADNEAALRLFRGLALPAETTAHRGLVVMRIQTPG
ncbi:MAG TPA: GNAT family protein [Caldilineaceae bacterium]|nr:GNAT family protein [Caldilineaceae bacterium]